MHTIYLIIAVIAIASDNPPIGNKKKKLTGRVKLPAYGELSAEQILY